MKSISTTDPVCCFRQKKPRKRSKFSKKNVFEHKHNFNKVVLKLDKFKKVVSPFFEDISDTNHKSFDENYFARVEEITNIRHGTADIQIGDITVDNLM